MSRYYRLLLDDYSAASFTSFSKDYYGTLEQIGSLFDAIRQDDVLAEQKKYILGIYDRYIAGESKVSHKVAYRDVPFLVPAKVLGTESSVLTDYTWEHTNTWGFPYLMKCDKAKCTHIWFSCDGKYSRCIQVQFKNLQYKNAVEKYVALGSRIWGYPEQIAGVNGNLHNRLFVEEKVFENKAEAMSDRLDFLHNPDPQFDEFLNDIFGDG